MEFAPHPSSGPCLCNALRQASRTVTRLYDEELRDVGLRTTQFTLLSLLNRAGEVRQGDLSGRLLLEETTLTRNLRALVNSKLVAIRPGTDRREKLVALTPKGSAKLEDARPAWARAQERMKALLSQGLWDNLLGVLPVVAKLAAEA
jgi:DNA-binding MarR family transcriptional regulator